ncbi:thiosulfate/3-mercaptopyruvate sulfurtransferase [Roseibium hamelinense]|uniref:Thiosulfate/3-mercaptopyruvate sulfurtransferase n=1 Tax=Roseibium hamelinense TaxID=150831 RepID=A0A562T7E6_9HYPH|nr:sulfurtransferase [Roseibium hamelinense]MTI42056.1 sulfurtransferase [Roseibium hamelinense]TWI89521.1 thiosulfate/3-mercaptopyruvate sulfurtransferase [Roseibium hamelinense]
MLTAIATSVSRFAAVVLASAIGSVATAQASAPAVTPLVSTQWLANNLENDNLIVLDIRSPIAEAGRDDYLKAHIPGALWSEYPGYWRTERNGVAGVVPSVDKLEAALSDLGVSGDKAVVIVPAGTSSLEFGAATRIYWTFKYLGHEAVAILDGGHQAWASEGRPLQTGDVTPTGDLFVAEVNEDLLVSTDQVAEALDSNIVLLDGRPQDQFKGKAKHKKAVRYGHLPGAVNIDQAGLYDPETNRLKNGSALEKLIPANFGSDEQPVISYCNTGHWAATNWFVLNEVLGRKNVTLYDDSMVGWSQRQDLPVNATAAPADVAN